VLGLIDLGETLGELQPSDIERILSALGCQVTLRPAQEGVDGDSAAVSLSGLRAVDLIEEIARVYGYNNFCETPDKREAGYLSVEQQLIRRLREAFRQGLTELIHYSLVKPGQERQVVLANPFAEYSALRTELLSGLIDAFEYNQSQEMVPSTHLKLVGSSGGKRKDWQKQTRS